MIELGEGERRLKAETARGLLLRDGDCSLERFLGERGTGGIALQQDFAAPAMEERELRMLPELMRESQSLVNASQRPFRAKGLCLELGEKRVEEWRGEHLALSRQGRQRLPKFCGGGRGIIETAPRPSRK